MVLADAEAGGPLSDGRNTVRLRPEQVTERIGQLQEIRSRLDAEKTYYPSHRFRRLLAEGAPLKEIRPSRSQKEYIARVVSAQRSDLVEEIAAQARELPDHLGSRLLKPHPYKVAIVADSFLYASFEGTAELLYVTPENYTEVAASADVLLVASAWRGLNGEWTPGEAKNRLKNTVMPYFRSRDIPVVFYSKEDPPNYQKFLPFAAAADFIITSAAEKIPDYQRSLPDARGYEAITFGVNPLLHNPVESRRFRRQEVMFAGSWLRHKYPQRRRHSQAIFDGVLDAGRDLLILDRNSALGHPDYSYPEEYLSHLGPGVEHSLLMKMQRITDLQINLNSVNGSSTMFANRVVEMQAMGVQVLSNYSLGVNDLFPNVILGTSRFETEANIRSRGTGLEIYEDQMRGVRTAFSHHLAHDRMAEILRVAGLKAEPVSTRVAVVRPEGALLAPQTQPGCEILTPEQARPEALSRFDVVVPLRNGMDYGPFVVEDLVNGFKYADVDFVEKAPVRAVDAGHRQVSSPTEGACVAYDAQCYAEGRPFEGGYRIDPFGLAPVSERVELREAEDSSVSVPTDDAGRPRLSVVVPIFNNGPYLRDKCFRSLRRSSVFEKMEILLVDDGSTDGVTPEIVRELTREHPGRVRAFFNPTGGSGSASRPRNQGLELASAEFITYLDPDNEAVDDGFAKLLRIMEHYKTLDFAIGNMAKYVAGRTLVNNASLLRRKLDRHPRHPNSSMIRKSGPEALQKIGFQPMSIQALVARTSWLRGTGIQQPEGALGQDSLMFQEMLAAARKIAVTTTVIHVYYGAVSTSVVNTLRPKFYRKYLPLERARISWLEREGLMESYRETRLLPYFEGWYLKKYNRNVRPEDRPESQELIRELAAMYGLGIDEAANGDLSVTQ